MIKIICGEKGRGKTKHMLELANKQVSKSNGSVIFIDKSEDKIYDLNNEIRLIDITQYPIKNQVGFIGFISGLLAGNHDIDCIFIDSLLNTSTTDNIDSILRRLNELSKDVEFVVSISLSKEHIPDSYKDKIIVSL